MKRNGNRAKYHGFAAAAAAIGFTAVGCGPQPSAGIRQLSVDASAVAEQVIEQYDASADGALDETELAKCQPLASRVALYDVDGNGQLSHEELTARFEKLCGSGSSVVNVDCTVIYRKRPLPGANVLFRPVASLEGQTLPALGTTDDGGAARPGIAKDNMPEELKQSSVMQPGLYYVEITHPELRLASRYNTETALGFEVDPASRNGLKAQFDLE